MGSILHMNVCFRMILVLACSIPAVALAALQFRYDTEYEAIQYSASTPSGAVAQLLVRIAS
jgi:hypothetical protein